MYGTALGYILRGWGSYVEGQHIYQMVNDHQQLVTNSPACGSRCVSITDRSLLV